MVREPSRPGAVAAAKLLAVLVLLGALHWRAQVPAGDLVALVAAIVAVSVLLFNAAVRLFSLDVTARGVDRACIAVSSLSITFPAVIVVAGLIDSWLASVTVVAAAAALVWWKRPFGPGSSGENPVIAVPAAMYWLAAAYAIWSVAAPFGHFNQQSIVRELYTDGFQRFGAIHALSEHVPPANPFVSGVPFRYYWFSLAPFAALVRLVSSDAFVVWKVLLTLQAFCFAVSLWWCAASLLRQRRAAWVTASCALVFASAEILWHPRLFEALRALGPSAASFRAAIAALTSIDPDHVAGVIVTYSDQLLMEDFLYIPQNGAALALFLAVIWLVQQQRLFAAGWIIALCVGTNTFFALPGGAALVAVALVSSGPARALLLGAWLGAWSIPWAVICRIVPVPGERGALVTAVVVSVFVAAAIAWVVPRVPSKPMPAGLAARAVAAGIAALLIGMGLLVTLRPRSGTAGLILNYSPALLLAVPFLLHRLWFGARDETRWFEPTLLFLVAFGAVYYGLVTFLAAPFQIRLPLGLDDLAFSVGDAINPFNFTHKVAKGMRIIWCLLAGLAAMPVVSWLGRSRQRTIIAALVLIAALPVTAATTVLRPLTYMRDTPVPEAQAAQYLRSHGINLATVVLIENIRRSHIHQLVPVSTYFISSWSSPDRSLSATIGTWADQYVPARWHEVVKAREIRNQAIFGATDVGGAIRRLSAETRLDYVLTMKPYDLAKDFRLVVDVRGGYLYERLPAPR